MPTAVLASLAAVISTAEFCASPFDGGTGEPQFCRLTAEEEIATPYFSIIVDPQFLVGVHRDGRRLQAQPSLRQSQVHLIIEVTESSNEEACPRPEQAISFGGAEWRACAEALSEFTAMRLTARVDDRLVVVRYGYSPLGAEFAETLDHMVRSIKLHAI